MEGLDLLKIGEAIKIRRIKKDYYSEVNETKALLKLKRIFDCTLDELVDPENYDELGKKKEKVKRYKLVRCSE